MIDTCKGSKTWPVLEIQPFDTSDHHISGYTEMVCHICTKVVGTTQWGKLRVHKAPVTTPAPVVENTAPQNETLDTTTIQLKTAIQAILDGALESAILKPDTRLDLLDPGDYETYARYLRLAKYIFPNPRIAEDYLQPLLARPVFAR